ncbi:MAG: hypothetical protein V7L29_11815 [Nostoc sp.]|uniref:hypothetical protein n=1 Tax=Nostoc sp. TaxID=1180 RepID=UPI002FF22ADD
MCYRVSVTHRKPAIASNNTHVYSTGASEATSTLSQARMIAYHRGQIKILNREALEKTSCECYQILENEFVRLLGLLPNKQRK